MRQQRDHAADYARRIALGEQRGFSRKRSRGHRRAGEAPLRAGRASQPKADLEAALRALHLTRNRAQAAKSVNIAPETFRRFLTELGDKVEITGRGKSLKIADHRPREVSVFTRGKARVLRLRDRDQASLNGRHQAIVGKFLDTRDRELLREFEGQVVIDTRGKRHLLETDPNALLKIAATEDDVFHEIYRLIS